MSNLSLKTGFTPVQTRVTLANNATTVVQNFAAYDAQELTGFVYIDATTDYRAAVKVTIFKNGAGTYEIAISDVAGDLLSGAPIVSFSISSVGVLSATLVSFAGYVTAYIQFNLNAPALGGQFPLQVDGANVSLATSTVQGAYKAGQAPGQVSGATIGAGFIGETISANFNTGGTAVGTANVFVNMASISVSAGVWQLTSQTTVNSNTNASQQFTLAISENSGNTTTDHVEGVNQLLMGTYGIAGSNPVSAVTVTYIKNFSGANKTIYSKVKCDNLSGRYYSGQILAIRIA